MWLLGNWRIALSIAVAVGIIGGFLYWKHKIKEETRAEVAAEVVEIYKEKEFYRRKNYHDAQGIDRDSIVRELCQLGFVRNKTACPS